MMILHHVGFQEIREPDVHYGRANADFGQGFYLSGDEDFSRRWARQRPGRTTFLNTYELETCGLEVKHLRKDQEWFDYIFANRAGKPDAFPEFDVVVGPIANDTIYDTWGLLTSGLVGRNLALQVLMIGPVYEQVALKTDKAAATLRFVSAEVLAPDEIARYRDSVKDEEARFQEQFGELVANLQA